MMEAHDVVAIADSLDAAGVPFWIDGGWGVDALVGEQTRAHDDLDLVIELGRSDRAMRVLLGLGFRVMEDERPTRFVVQVGDRRVDFHTVSFDEEGGGIQVLQDGRTYRYPAEGFRGTGVIDSRTLPCLTPEVQVECHTGYQPDATDFHDMRVLRERLGVDVPPPFA